MKYRVYRRTLSYNKPGLNPTTKNGTDMGWVEVGFEFTAAVMQNGWLAIQSNKWVKASDCEPVPDEPPPPVNTGVVWQTRYSYDGGVTWTPWETWDKRNG